MRTFTSNVKPSLTSCNRKGKGSMEVFFIIARSAVYSNLKCKQREFLRDKRTQFNAYVDRTTKAIKRQWRLRPQTLIRPWREEPMQRANLGQLTKMSFMENRWHALCGDLFSSQYFPFDLQEAQDFHPFFHHWRCVCGEKRKSGKTSECKIKKMFNL